MSDFKFSDSSDINSLYTCLGEINRFHRPRRLVYKIIFKYSQKFVIQKIYEIWYSFLNFSPVIAFNVSV